MAAVVEVVVVVEAALIDRCCGEILVNAVLVVVLQRGCGDGLVSARECDFRLSCRVLDKEWRSWSQTSD